MSKQTDYIRNKLIEVTEGNLSALDLYIELKEIESLTKEALKDIQEDAVSEATKYGEKTFEHLNAKITVKHDAGKWSYDHIEQWKEKKKEVALIEAKAKQAYENNKSGLYAVAEDGEVMEPAKFTEGKLNISVQIIDNQTAEKLPF